MSVRRFFRRRRADAELLREIDAFLTGEIAENLARGMSPEEARRQAHLKFGNPQRVRESLWQQNTITIIDTLWRELKYAVRTLARTPGFAAIAILVMALGIGGNVALFTVVRSVLLKPLPYRDADRLFAIYEHNANRPDSYPFLPVDAGSFLEWQRATQSTAEMATVSPWQDYSVSADGGKLPEKISAGWCSWNFFPLLGITPALGRSFTSDDDRPQAMATAVLTYSFWKRRYSGDPGIVGKAIFLDARPYTVVGVLPATFTFSSAFGGNRIQVWTPVHREAPPALLATYEDHEFLVFAHLREGATLPMLMDQLNAIQAQIQAAHPDPAVHDAVMGRSMLDDVVTSYKTSLYALLVATGCVLLIACMNVAGLLVARAAARSKDLAIRAALGGSRLRLLRERLLESLVLSAAGGALGILLAWIALGWLVHVRGDMNRVEAIHIDGTVAAFTVGVIVLCALFAGLISALSSNGSHVMVALQESSRSHSGGTARARLRKVLLVLEVGLTVVLLVGGGLLLKSYQRLRSTDIGVPVENVLTMHVSLPEVRYKRPVQQVAFFEQLIGRVRALPGVQAAGLVSTPPGEGWNGDRMMQVVEHPPLPKKEVPDVMVRGAEPGYFSAIRIPLLRGRIFTLDERLQRANVAVISRTTAQTLFPNDDPIGKHLRSEEGGDVYEVVGIVGDTRWSIAQPIKPTLYWPIYGNNSGAATIVIRSTHNVESLALPVQRVISQLDPDLPVYDVTTLREAIGKSTIDSEFSSILVVAFSVIALALAGAGLYGVLAYLITQRTNEIGVRIALGAQRDQLLSLMLLGGLKPALLGLALGLTASAVAARLIRSMLYETQPLDPAVFGCVVVALLAVAMLACIAPAWRASRLDPAQALRSE
jgi:putative ABC transport system permease protein